jgi:hypothetical protein
VKRKRKIHKRKSLFPIIGKYIDTPTKAELPVVSFVDDTGNFQFVQGNSIRTNLNGCRLQFKTAHIKRKMKFYKQLKPFLDFSSGYRLNTSLDECDMPVIFGLLKLRKGKKRYFILITSAEQFFVSRVITIHALKMDNLLYLDFVEQLKKKA